MPGIAGLITDRPREWAEPRVSTMLDAMRHGASFESGAWADTELGVYAGWTKRRGAAPVAQPVWNEREDLGLIFSGEEFSAEATADSPGYLVHLAGDGTGFPGNCNGRFHGILLNRRDRSGLLFNDRYGIHRLYWHESAGAMYFAAEAKAILAVCPELRELDPASLGEYVACGCVLENRTLFRGVGVVPGGRGLDVSKRENYGKEAVLSPPGMGNAGTAGPGDLLPESAGRVLATAAGLLRRIRARGNVSDRRSRHPDDPGLAQAPGRFAALLLVREHVPPVPGCFGGAAGRGRMRTAAQRDSRGWGVPVPISALCRAFYLSDGRMRGCESQPRPFR